MKSELTIIYLSSVDRLKSGELRMFGSFKKVSEIEQLMLTDLASELIDQIYKIESECEFYNSLTNDHRLALEKYKAAAHQCLKWGKHEEDNMTRIIWNAGFKRLSAASRIMHATLYIAEK